MTPDSFYQVKPDLKPGTIHDGYHHNPVQRSHRPVNSNKNFEKILSRKDDKKNKDDLTDDDLVSDKEPNNSKKDLVDASGLPVADDHLSQLQLLGKEGKMVPSLGSELPSSLPQEPESLPLVNLAMSTQTQNNDVALDQSEINKMLGKVPDTVPLVKVDVQTPNLGLTPDKAATSLADAEKTKKSPADLFSEIGNEARLHKREITKNGDDNNGGINLINTMLGPTENLIAQSAAIAQTSKAAEIMKALADQLVDQINVIADKTHMDTTIQLKYPPLLEGVTVTITSFTNARGEFNISIDNLTQQAKNVLDMAANRTSLLEALDQKGFTVHIISTSTVERNYTTETSGMNKQDNGKERENDQPDQQQKQKQK